ncbi:DUF4238 domain-containing protein [Flavobacterium piscisymbiosum]|uniref:DUF4238 domain-containing protein n=1 Tax=Flavobacterium piscisymbiosum TaxID=2893753 RepID=A0ABS8MDX9_9FLAO|nr:DUF4238 domain-containing protein [Flavobacterium sp. F-30]MCC9063720.1 DUF4238 domain-containing protein [Flavobacterium sp. F-30]
MAGNLVKRQHFVPRTYLKHFARQDGQDYLICALPNSSTDKDKIFEVNIKNIGLEKDFYTLPGETDDQKMAIENFYAEEFEQHYSTIYDILVNPVKTEVTPEERKLIISTVITMYYRTTKWVNASKSLMSRVFYQMFQLCEQTGKDYFVFEGEKISIAGKTLEQFTKEFNEERQPHMILTQLEVAFKLINIRVQVDAITVVRLGEDDLEFVISDNPVIASNPTATRFAPFDPNNLLYLPLDPKHMLILIPEKSEGLENRIFRRTSTGFMAAMEKLTSNYQQMENSEKFMMGTRDELESYLDTKDITEKPTAEMSEEDRAALQKFIGKFGI